VTAEAAVAVLEAGGNAFDAAAAALCASFVAEPLLSSPGGGGFLLASPAGGAPRVYDFFTHTPLAHLERGEPDGGTVVGGAGNRRPGDDREVHSADVDFREVEVDFGSARQTFQIGLGSAATPGAVAGLFEFHRDLGRMPLREVVSPAVARARDGVTVTALQAYLATILRPILLSAPDVEAVFAPGGSTVAEGELQRMPELADLLETLAIEGPDLFYRGEVAAAVDLASREGGGHLRREDFLHYRVELRSPLEFSYRGHTVWTNPPPASGGVLVAFGLGVLGAGEVPADPLGPREALRLAEALVATGRARSAEGLEADVDLALARRFLDPETLARYRNALAFHPPAPRGTSHLGVVDAAGNAASLSISNGEGCGWVLPGGGFMLNNMLGEADLQPRGFGRWRPGVRLTSMMAPTLVQGADGYRVTLGSGGSNRIRSAILQVLVGIVDHRLDLETAVARPRLHAEGEHLDIEGGWPDAAVEALVEARPHHAVWPDPNLFFGGVHVAGQGPDGAEGAGDPRRGGVARVLPGGR
jgi:gamma-glutamyltranspeptidase / glutathione hydrolase